MKRIFMASLLALTVALGAVATGCSGSDNSSSSTDKASSKVESVNDSSADDSGTAEGGNSVDGDFVWDENSCIVNLSKEAAKKSDKLTIYVKKGSYADEHFADFADKSNVEKAYY